MSVGLGRENEQEEGRGKRKGRRKEEKEGEWKGCIFSNTRANMADTINQLCMADEAGQEFTLCL